MFSCEEYLSIDYVENFIYKLNNFFFYLVGFYDFWK